MFYRASKRHQLAGVIAGICRSTAAGVISMTLWRIGNRIRATVYNSVDGVRWLCQVTS